MTYTAELDDLDAIAAGSIGASFAYRYRLDGRRASVTVESRALVTSASGWGADRAEPAPITPTRPARFLAETIPTVPVGQGLVPWIEEIDTTTGAGSASAVNEAGPKPEVPLRFTGNEAPLDKVAAYLNATDELLADAVGLRDYIDRRLVLHLLAAQDRDLYATFAADLNVQVQAFTTNVLTTLANALAKVETAAGTATGIAMRPADYFAMLIANPTATAIDATAGTMWGVPVIRTLGVPAGRALAGDFATGAVIRERDTTVKVSDSHSTNFVTNLTTILAERRYLLNVNAPQSFAVAALS